MEIMALMVRRALPDGVLSNRWGCRQEAVQGCGIVMSATTLLLLTFLYERNAFPR